MYNIVKYILVVGLVISLSAFQSLAGDSIGKISPNGAITKIYSSPSLFSKVVYDIPTYIQIKPIDLVVKDGVIWVKIQAKWNFLIFQGSFEGWATL